MLLQLARTFLTQLIQERKMTTIAS